MTEAVRPPWRQPYNLYRLFKYSVYSLLAVNVFLFFLEDYRASAAIFSDGVSWRNVVEAYSATIDTAAWVILLLLFELETAVIDDEKLEGSLRWVLFGIRAVCYFFIVYACYGYWVKWATVSQVLPFAIDDACSLIGSDFTWVEDLDEYIPIDAASCQQLNKEPLLQIAETQIIGTTTALTEAIRLAVVDIVNAMDWILVVLVLEIEVFLQPRGRLTDGMVSASKYLKVLMYSVLLACAIYWGIKGDFLDFWDAFMWLVAFVFIELNIFEWHGETGKGGGGVEPQPA
ncbi:MAG: hypothetical protein QNJ40_07480 [Xanthomonadales bacterium]|nr:hypothetical protein [Xanthomonadales bacterium]